MKLKYIIVLLLVLMLAGCVKQPGTGQGVTGQATVSEPVQLLQNIPKTQAPNPPTLQTQHVVEVYSSAFVPESVTIKIGETVTWKVLEGRHLVSDLRRNFQSARLETGNTYMVTFDKPGVYTYIDQVRKFYGEVIVI